MKRFFTYLKTELKLSVRDMNMVIFAVIMPSEAHVYNEALFLLPKSKRRKT